MLLCTPSAHPKIYSTWSALLGHLGTTCWHRYPSISTDRRPGYYMFPTIVHHLWTMCALFSASNSWPSLSHSMHCTALHCTQPHKCIERARRSPVALQAGWTTGTPWYVALHPTENFSPNLAECSIISGNDGWSLFVMFVDEPAMWGPLGTT